jgi:hypothetical protein
VHAVVRFDDRAASDGGVEEELVHEEQ